MDAHTIVIDRGWKRIKREHARLHGRGVKVGLLAGGPASAEGVAVVDYATFNEFGTSTIPARPFMRRTADREQRNVSKFAHRLVAAVIAGRMTREGLLDALGLWYQMKMRSTIRTARRWATPLAPATIRAKRSTAPLIDDGVMLGAINYEIE
jgi:hypothetical protein